MKVIYLFIAVAITLITPSALGASFNGSFEDSLQGWSIIKPPAGYVKGDIQVQSEIVKEESHALRLGGNAEKSLARIKSVRIPIPTLRNIEFRGWYQFEAEPKAVVEIDVVFYDKNGELLSPMTDYWQRTRLTRSKEWNEFHIPLTLNKAAQSMSVTIYYVGGTGEAYLDDLQFAPLNPVTMPSTGYMLNGLNSPGAEFSTESSLKKVYADGQKPSRAKNEITLSAAKGETEAVQIVIWPKTSLTDIEVLFGDLKKGFSSISGDVLQARFVESVTSPNQSPKGRPGAIPDLLSKSTHALLTANKPQAIWTDIQVPRSADAGLYRGEIYIKAKGLSQIALPLVVEVYDIVLPEQPKLITMAHDWGKPESGKEVLWKNKHEHRISGGASPIDPKIVPNSSGWNGLPPAKLTPDIPVQVSSEGNVSIDWTTWDKGTEKYFSTYGFTVFNVPNVFIGNVAQYFRGKDGKGSWFGLDIGSSIWEKAFSSYVEQVDKHFRKQGISQYAIWQVWDEPKPKHYPAIQTIADIIHKKAPGAQVLVTREVTPELIGAVDIWVDPLSQYDAELSKPRRKAGEKSWIYDNSLYITDVDITPYRLRTAPWALYRNDISGLLWWAIAYWKKDPQTSNGYGNFLYPNSTGGIDDSIRWENYRDGVEDYDYLWLLAEAQDTALKKLNVSDSKLSGNVLAKSVMDKMFPEPFNAKVNVEELMNLRSSIANAIVRLNRDPKSALTDWP